MFSTILDKVTGSFDKRVLISAFFPSLVFWGLTVVVFIGFQVNWQVAVQTWDTFSVTIQFLLLLAFFIWVMFWSFLTINFRMTFTRLLEGYWPEGRLLRWRRAYWQNRWKPLSEKDDLLAAQEAILLREQRYYQQLQASFSSPPAQPAVASHADDTDTVGQDLGVFLDTVGPRILPSTQTAEPADPSLEDIQKWGEQTRSWWIRLVPWLELAQRDQQSPWASRLAQLDTITRTLTALVERRVEEIQAQRVSLYRDLSLYYPPSPVDIMATRLGNVLKASELYSWKRYRLDAVVLWPRLQASLPDTFSNPLQDTKASFDLMVTLCAFLLLFGVPLSCWVAFKATGSIPWIAALTLTVIFLLFRLYVPVCLALLAAIIALPLFHPPIWLAHIQALIVLLTALVLLFWLCYQNAVEAALDYAEKIKAAIDLYRWQVLQALHLQFPKDFEEERKLWGEVGGLFLRGYTPDARYYHYSQEQTPGQEEKPKQP